MSPEPEKRQEHIDELESIDNDVRKLFELKNMATWAIDLARQRVKDISLHFATEYDSDRLVRSANWYFRNVSHLKDECGREPQESDCAEDGLAYIEECLGKALGEQQLYRIVDVRYGTSRESLEVSFTIPESLGVWALCMPLSTEWKPSLHEYLGRYKESSPYPMQMSITYTSPTSGSLIQSVMNAWTFEDMARQWFTFDMQSHRQRQYMPYKVDEEGYVWKKVGDPILSGLEMKTDVTEQEYMSYVRKYHNDMIPEWSR